MGYASYQEDNLDAKTEHKGNTLKRKTVVITQSGRKLNPYHNWFYSIDLNPLSVDSFRVGITARKREMINFKTTDEITILQYNRVRGTSDCMRTLNAASEMLQNLLNAIENGDEVWDAREH